MAKDQGTPRADVVDVAVAVGIPDVGALAADKERRLAANRAESTHGRVDAAGDELLGTFLQVTGFVKNAGHGSLFAFR